MIDLHIKTSVNNFREAKAAIINLIERVNASRLRFRGPDYQDLQMAVNDLNGGLIDIERFKQIIENIYNNIERAAA